MKIVFFGTPHYTIEYLELLANKHEIVAVITPPDRKSGRGRQIQAPAPAKWAKERGIKLLQPESLNDEDFQKEFRAIKADIALIIAYGKMIPDNLLYLLPHDMLNVHFSLLPRFRGASPVEAALLAGDKIGGVTIQKISHKLDSGDILIQETVSISEKDHFPELIEKLNEAGKKAVIKAFDLIETNDFSFNKQNEEKAIHCSKIDPSERNIDWNESATDILNKIRAFSGHRTTISIINNKKVLIHRAEFAKLNAENNAKPGDIIQANKEGLIIQCKENGIKITLIQPENKKKMDYISFINGNHIKCSIIIN